MVFLSKDEKAFCQAVSRLGYCNPFLPERIELEKEALGDAFVPWRPMWSKRPAPEQANPNVDRLVARAESLVRELHARLVRGVAPKEDETALYEDLVLFLLFHNYADNFDKILVDRRKPPRAAGFYQAFQKETREYLAPVRKSAGTEPDVAHVFACFFQLRRAFHHIFRFIMGETMPAARLRAAVWQSIFTHDMRRYRRVLFDRMGEIACLITGPSGTGKELVARAIGLSSYIPFDPKTETFAEDFAETFFPLNLSSLSPTLIESELFGHRRGSFTGALQDRTGWFEVCTPRGAVFLDEIGEIDPGIQVKLLRVLEMRVFQRIGDTEKRMFHGKVIAATNRCLDEEMRKGRFREDLYYRLCSDLIVAPSLREHLADSPGAMPDLVRYVSERLTNQQEADALAEEATKWILENLGRDYAWPGNFRELEQCIRNILVRKAYAPAHSPAQGAARGEEEAFLEAVSAGRLSAEELLQGYCNLVHRQCGTCQETARRLGLDHRTVKARLREK